MYPTLQLRRSTSLPRPQYNARRIQSTALPNALPQLQLSQRRPLSSPSQNSPPISSRLAGRTCMITGGTSGIGFAIAHRFLQEGAERIILVGRSHERLVTAASKLQGTDSKTPLTLQTQTPDLKLHGTLIDYSDKINLLVGDVSEAGSWLRELEKAMQKVDILINSAGISNTNILPKTPASEISLTLRTNLEAAILTSRALLRASLRNRLKTHTAASKSKCIINISSLLAHRGGTGAVPYAASKAGILGLTRSLAVEAAGSVRSNAIVPGYIETPMIAGFSEGVSERLRGSIPVGRFGEAGEIADAAVFLAGNEYANNCVVSLDGGLSAV
ncbi:hypothetical protein ETB97_006091 [Aspergillus alliaceus]|uniref:Uncharacterized protein n=1 Tax=Petromyces alliaceus TaxID=209559 RepID=A0A5N6GAB5_PETAA|nr:uncharacterized protein BDW43DRAFT_152627 [Aspergillus alliaceus]KAB8238070.1 hypothetical protein BDW43DRAFT_152627 [Aspergillus alliaceus]KAF5864865.1 hypothetical protein ETB97_006091 [Aspergillus burnettii]